jgi:tRNA A-37 threonylcarbamoyl transferase component Bud32
MSGGSTTPMTLPITYPAAHPALDMYALGAIATSGRSGKRAHPSRDGAEADGADESPGPARLRFAAAVIGVRAMPSLDQMDALCAAVLTPTDTQSMTFMGEQMRVLAGGISGSYGMTRQICDDKKCKYVVKIIDTKIIDNHGTSARHVMVEAETLKLASNAGVSPKYHAHKLCNGHGIIVMDRMDMTLARFMYSNALEPHEKVALANMVYDVVRRMHDVGIYHQDLHTGNVMVSMNGQGEVVDVKVIDFGKAIVVRGGLPAFVRACDLALLYYGFARDERPWGWSESSLCRHDMPMPRPFAHGGPSLPRAAIMAVVTYSDFMFLPFNTKCPKQKEEFDNRITVYTRPDLVYEALAECDGFAEFVRRSHDASAHGAHGGWGAFISAYTATGVVRSRCIHIFKQTYDDAPFV